MSRHSCSRFSKTRASTNLRSLDFDLPVLSGKATPQGSRAPSRWFSKSSPWKVEGIQLTAHPGNKAARARINPRTSLPLNKWPLRINWSKEAPVIPGLLICRDESMH